MSDTSSDCDFELESDSDEVDDQQIELENLVHTSLQDAERAPATALAGLRRALTLESAKGEWGFMALTEIVKICLRGEAFGDALDAFRQLLQYVRSAVTRNASETSINAILDTVASAKALDERVLETFHLEALAELRATGNDRLWFKTKLRMGRALFARRQWPAALRVVRELEAACRASADMPADQFSSQLLEVAALEIQLVTESRETARLRELYSHALTLKSAIAHPRIVGVIRECGGKMHMSAKAWREAYQDFFEAFKCYDEAGDARKVNCLRYLVVASMLAQSGINPFDSNEAKAYRDDPQVVAMNTLLDAYARGDLAAFERTLATNRASICDDPHIAQYVDELLSSVRSSYVLALVRPYAAVRLAFVAETLRVDVAHAEALVLALVLDGRLSGRIDQVAGVFTAAADGAAAPLSAPRHGSAAAALSAAVGRVVERAGDQLSS